MRRLRVGAFFLFALWFMLCSSLFPRSYSIFAAPARSEPQLQFTFVPHIPTLDLGTAPATLDLGPLGTPAPAVTAAPTLGPGQAFQEGDSLPAITRPGLLENPFGYSEIVGRPGLYLVWSTDEQGNRSYYVITESNRYYEGITAAQERLLQAQMEFDEQAPPIRIAFGAAGTVIFGFLAVGCGAGALGSAAGVVTSPAAVPLTACATASAGLAAGSFKSGLDAAGALDGYNTLVDQLSQEVEGYFMQFPYVSP